MQQKPTLRRALRWLVFNTVIALGIATFMGNALWENLVYSQCIGLCIWVFMDWPVLADQGHANAVAPPDLAGTGRRGAGYVAGTLLGAVVFPAASIVLLDHPPQPVPGFSGHQSDGRCREHLLFHEPGAACHGPPETRGTPSARSRQCSARRRRLSSNCCRASLSRICCSTPWPICVP